MSKYIDVDKLEEWLKTIPVHDMSDCGIAKYIFLEDFQKAIKTLPKYAIVEIKSLSQIEVKR